jgi:hypothetical protein
MAASATLPTADKRLVGLYLLDVETGRGSFERITTVATFQRNRKALRAIIKLMRQIIART